MSKPLTHYAVCVEMNGQRIAYVESHPAWRQTYLIFPKDPKRIGYVGFSSFLEAIDCASRMERNENWLAA